MIKYITILAILSGHCFAESDLAEIQWQEQWVELRTPKMVLVDANIPPSIEFDFTQSESTITDPILKNLAQYVKAGGDGNTEEFVKFLPQDHAANFLNDNREAMKQLVMRMHGHNVATKTKVAIVKQFYEKGHEGASNRRFLLLYATNQQKDGVNEEHLVEASYNQGVGVWQFLNVLGSVWNFKGLKAGNDSWRPKEAEGSQPEVFSPRDKTHLPAEWGWLITLLQASTMTESPKIVIPAYQPGHLDENPNEIVIGEMQDFRGQRLEMLPRISGAVLQRAIAENVLPEEVKSALQTRWATLPNVLWMDVLITGEGLGIAFAVNKDDVPLKVFVKNSKSRLDLKDKIIQELFTRIVWPSP